MKKKVCIIGAGIGGLTAGALLLKKGYSVDIFEKEPTVGGRALSLEMSSQTIDSYKQTLAKFNTAIVFSEPSLEDIFKNKMFDGYTLDLGFHMIGSGIVDKLRDYSSWNILRISPCINPGCMNRKTIISVIL